MDGVTLAALLVLGVFATACALLRVKDWLEL